MQAHGSSWRRGPGGAFFASLNAAAQNVRPEFRRPVTLASKQNLEVRSPRGRARPPSIRWPA